MINIIQFLHFSSGEPNHLCAPKYGLLHYFLLLVSTRAVLKRNKLVAKVEFSWTFQLNEHKIHFLVVQGIT